jgi:hypothetical protein
MRGFLVVAVLLGTTASAPAAELRDFSKPQTLAAVSHGSWTSYEIYKEDELSVHLIHVDARSRRNVYRLQAGAVMLSLHRQLTVTKNGAKLRTLKRGDFLDQPEGALGGGWSAGKIGPGADMLFIIRSADMPQDLGPEAGKKEKAARRVPNALYSFAEARAKADALTGPLRRVPLLDGPSLKVILLRVAGRSAIKNPAAASSWILFPVEGAVNVRTNGAGTDLSGNRVFIAPPGATLHLDSPRGTPVYLLLITPKN